MFTDSLRAGQLTAAEMSLIQIAQLNGHDPYAYIKDVPLEFSAIKFGRVILSAPVAQRDTHTPQPLHNSTFCSTAVFFQALVSNENSRNSHAEIHLPQPEQRAGSIFAFKVVMAKDY